MGEIQDLYDSRVKSMAPAERLQLARLIFDGLAAPESTVDISDRWSEDDMADVSVYSARKAAERCGPTSESIADHP